MSEKDEHRPLDEAVEPTESPEAELDAELAAVLDGEPDEATPHVRRKLIACLATIVGLLLVFALATYAISTLSVSVPNNYFETGSVEINLNDGKPVIDIDEFRFEPGMTVTKDFFLENRSTWAVYFKLYMTDVQGELADVLRITIADKAGNTLYQGTASELTRADAPVADEALEVDETREFTITFFYPREAGNATQGDDLSFTLCADAVQTKNNPNAQFD